MYNNGSSSTVTHVSFSGNSATDGGGMYNISSSPTVTQATFSENTATYGGGMHNSVSSPTVTHVTFSRNTATTHGGGMYNFNSSPKIASSIFWESPIGNNTGNKGTPVVAHSIVQGGYTRRHRYNHTRRESPSPGLWEITGALWRRSPLEAAVRPRIVGSMWPVREQPSTTVLITAPGTRPPKRAGTRQPCLLMPSGIPPTPGDTVITAVPIWAPTNTGARPPKETEGLGTAVTRSSDVPADTGMKKSWGVIAPGLMNGHSSIWWIPGGRSPEAMRRAASLAEQLRLE